MKLLLCQLWQAVERELGLRVFPVLFRVWLGALALREVGVESWAETVRQLRRTVRSEPDTFQCGLLFGLDFSRLVVHHA